MSSIATPILETVLTLGAVGLLGLATVVLAKRMGVGRAHGPVGLVGSLPLEGRRAIYLVRIGTRVLVVGSAAGGLSRLGETSLAELEGSEDPSAGRSLADYIDQLETHRGGRTPRSGFAPRKKGSDSRER